jgi:hypothetical protein
MVIAVLKCEGLPAHNSCNRSASSDLSNRSFNHTLLLVDSWLDGNKGTLRKGMPSAGGQIPSLSPKPS